VIIKYKNINLEIFTNLVTKKELSDFSSTLFSSLSRHLLLIQSSASSTSIPLKKAKYVLTAPIDLHKKKANSTTTYFPNLV
jgi:hypothetical protein